MIISNMDGRHLLNYVWAAVQITFYLDLENATYLWNLETSLISRLAFSSLLATEKAVRRS